MPDPYRFELLDEDTARKILALTPRTAEMHALRIRAQRRLRPVTSPEELERNRIYLGKPKPSLLELARAAGLEPHQDA